MLSQFSVKRPYTVLVAVVLVIVLGIISFTTMTTDLLPDIELPYVVVFTPYPGASPEQVEEAVTKPLESALGTAGGLKTISSISNENTSIIILEFLQDVNMDSAVIELANSIDLVAAQLDSAVGKPMLLRINPEMIPVLVATVHLEGKDVGAVSEFVTETLLPAYERLDGVASVEAAGLIKKELQVKLNQEKIDELNEKVLADLEATFAEKQAELEEAEAELEEAREKLDDELADQREKLSAAAAELDSAIANLKALLAEEASLEAQKAAFEQEREAILSIIRELEKLIETYFPDLKEISDLTPEQYEALQLSPDMPDELTELTFQDILKLSFRLLAVEAELQNIQVRLMVISAMKPQLEQALEEATAGYEELEAGKIMLSTELAKTIAQLENGLAGLEKGREELENAREEAFKQADLNNMITAEMLDSILKAQNFSMPAGYLEEGEEGHLVKVLGRYDSVEALQETILFSLESVGDIRLIDVADVTLTDNADENYAKVNGNDGILLVFQKQSTASTVEVTEKINALSDELCAQHEGLRILALMDQGKYINMSVDSVLENLLLGGTLAIIVLIFFLKDIRPTLVIACSIPVSVLFAVTLMYFSNVTLNVISLSGLALGVGMLVDNSIVVIENIYRLRKAGVPVLKAAVQGTNQVGGAITASTLTTICVFLPIVFTKGISRQLFTDMGLTIGYSLLVSLAVALTVVPAMATTALRRTEEKRVKWFDSLVAGYKRMLSFSLDHKALVLTIVLLLFGLSIYGIMIMGIKFIPDLDTPQMSATLTMPEGSGRAETYAMNDTVMERILEIEAVESVGAMSGAVEGMEMMTFSEGDTLFYILLKEERNLTNKDVERMILEKTADLDAEITVNTSNVDLSVLGGSGIEVLIKGSDLDLLADAAEEVAEILRTTEGTRAVETSMEGAGIETRIIVDKDAAMREGLTVAQIYQELASVLDSGTESTTLSAGPEEYPVIVVSAKQEAITRENIGSYSFTVAGEDGTEKEVRLDEIATITESLSPIAITRENHSRYVTVSAAIASGYNIGLVTREFEKALAGYTPPAGTSIEIAGENELISTAIDDVILMAILAVIFIYLIMVAQFQNLLSPFIIMFTLPLAFTGGLLLLWISGLVLSVPALLGFLVLAGIVVNNGIVFVDYVNQLRLEGKEKREALLETGATRLRPILMTALTTILAMSTIALGMGSGVEMTQPLAVVTIGGLTYATLLTLVVIPIIYDLLHRRPMQKIEIK